MREIFFCLNHTYSGPVRERGESERGGKGSPTLFIAFVLVEGFIGKYLRVTFTANGKCAVHVFNAWDCFLIMAISVKAPFRAGHPIDLPQPRCPRCGKTSVNTPQLHICVTQLLLFKQFNYRLFTVPYFSVRSSRSSALRYGLPSRMSVKTT